VTIYDPTVVEVADLGCNYYLTAADVGKSRRDAASVGKLSELNSYVRVSVLEPASGSLSTADLAGFNVVVFADEGPTGFVRPRAELEAFNEFCRTQSPTIGFVVVNVMGIAGRAFVDYGDAHIVHDHNGEQNRVITVSDITKGPVTMVNTDDGKRNGFEDGEYVIFRDVKGMVELNDGKPRKITRVRPYSFDIEEDSSSYGEFEICSATVEQTKVPHPVSFASFAERRLNPLPSDDPMGMLITPDLAKFGRPSQLHVAFEALEQFAKDRGGRLPSPHSEADETAVLEAAKAVCKAAHDGGDAHQLPEEVEEDIIRTVARFAAFELQPLAAFYGGIVAQEVVKFTGKFSPLRQFLYLDAMEVLPEKDHDLAAKSAADYTPMSSRYDHMVGIFGRKFVDFLQNRKVFVVGAGALGCEFLKNYALMGAGCGKDGHITVTDMDNIEVSNLNRQFLFRPHNVGAAKSVTAAAAASVMNPDMHIEALEVPVGPDTETTFDDEFWGGLDVVTNALDNIKARLYVDSVCVFYRKPLLESGTLGTKANTQVIAPFVTESYGDSQDPEEESIPMCTLKNFPHAIEHCIEWARDLFQGSFTATLQEAKSFQENPTDWLAKLKTEPNAYNRRQKLESVKNALHLSGRASWAVCVEEAMRLFHLHYFSNIEQLLHNFPKDYVSKETGVPFWSGHKRAPDSQAFSVDNDLHREFVAHTAALIAANFGVEVPADWDSTESLGRIASGVHLPPFAPKKVAIKSGDDDQTVEGGEDDDKVAATLVGELTALAADAPGKIEAGKFFPADFEKDDDSNHHIDFITAASNLRAVNYRISTAARHQVKIIAGKIIPAIATTTCAVTGLVGIEFLKVVRTPKIEPYRNTFMNLAVNMYTMSEPMPPKKTVSKDYDPITMGPVRAQPEGFTPWDRITLHGNEATTVGQLRDMIIDTQKVSIDVISLNIGGETKMLYAPLFAPSHRSREARPLLDVVQEMGLALSDKRRYLVLDIACNDDDGDVSIPRVQFMY
jgi:ubiquitin-activating enzyme E1